MIKTDLIIQNTNKSQTMLQDILSIAGIEINGNNPYQIYRYRER